MSRSNPGNDIPNPSRRWYEWNGEKGLFRYYDKENKETVEVGTDLTFIVLDQTGTIKGWHDASDSGIFSNAVRDTRKEPMTVKAFKGPVIADGLYRDIKDKVSAAGGHYACVVYAAVKIDDKLCIGAVQFHGTALKAWADFSKANRAELMKAAVKITGYKEDKKGRITFRFPTFAIAALSEQTNDLAIELDRELQAYLKAYFSRDKEFAPVKPATETDSPSGMEDDGFNEPPQSNGNTPWFTNPVVLSWDDCKKRAAEVGIDVSDLKAKLKARGVTSPADSRLTTAVLEIIGEHKNHDADPFDDKPAVQKSFDTEQIPF